MFTPAAGSSNNDKNVSCSLGDSGDLPWCRPALCLILHAPAGSEGRIKISLTTAHHHHHQPHWAGNSHKLSWHWTWARAVYNKGGHNVSMLLAGGRGAGAGEAGYLSCDDISNKYWVLSTGSALLASDTARRKPTVNYKCYKYLTRKPALIWKRWGDISVTTPHPAII